MGKPRKPAQPLDEQDLKRRAFAGYWRFAREGQPVATLDNTRADVVEVEKLLYVTLTTGKRRIAVFRVRHDGKLRRLIRIPRELKQDE